MGDQVIEPYMSSTEDYIPQWQDPQSSALWIEYEKPLFSEKEDIKKIKNETEVKILIKRDTINGIAVRSSGDIIIYKESALLHDRAILEEPFFNISYTSTNRYLGVNFDNDIFNNTDYYYTNGIRIDYVAPIFASSPLSYAMLPYRKFSMNYHGMTFVQNMYTPTNPDTSSIVDGDRPFAAYLLLGHFKNTLSNIKKYRQYSELQIGLIGPGSLGGMVQGQIHEIPPLGWGNQIQNDIVLNYTALVEKGLYNKKIFDVNVFAEGQVGTLYDNLGGGMRIRIGKFNPYFSMPWLATPASFEGSGRLKWQYGIFASAKAITVFYNATLQGGMFNKSSNYTIPAEDIERFIFEASGGIYLSYRQFGLTYEQFYTSPKFKDAHHFRWGHINLSFCF